MITEVYEALIAAGAPEEKARSAAEVLANYNDRLNRIERRLMILTWQIGIMTTAQVVIGLPALWLLVGVAAKVGALG